MGKPPTTDQELTARVAALESRADATDAALASAAEAIVDLDARVMALEAAGTVPPAGTHPDHELPRPPVRPDHTLPEPEPPEEIVDPPPEVTPPTTGRSVTIVLDGASHLFTQEGGKDLGAYTDPQGRFVQHCIAARCDTLPDFLVMFRPDADGTREEVVFEQGRLFAYPPGNFVNLTAYSAAIAKDGATLATVDVPFHQWLQRWRWQSAPRPVTVTPAQLVAQRLVPQYSTAPNQGLGIVGSPAGIWTYGGPMDSAGLLKAQTSTGDSDELGPLTASQAQWLLYEDDTLTTVLAQVDGAGVYNYHYRDENTGAPIDVVAYPNATNNNPTNAEPYLIWDGHIDPNSFLSPTHAPSIGYLAFLLTGDPYALEELQYQATFNIVRQPAGQRADYNYSQGLRGLAWTARTAGQVAKATPASVPSWLNSKEYWQARLDEMRDTIMARFVNGGPPCSTVFTYQDGESGYGPIKDYWESYTGVAVGWLVAIGFADWLPVLQWHAGYFINRTNGTSGWNRSQLGNDVLWNAPEPGTYVADFTDFFALNVTHGIVTDADPAHLPAGAYVEYIQLEYAALALAKQAGVPGTEGCIAWLLSEMQAQYNVPHCFMKNKWSFA